MTTYFEQWAKKQSKLDDISCREWEEFGKKYPVQGGFDRMCEIVKLDLRQVERECKLLDGFPAFKVAWKKHHPYKYFYDLFPEKYIPPKTGIRNK